MVGSPLPHVPPPLPRRNRSVLASLASRPLAAFPVIQAGRLPRYPFRGLLGVQPRCGRGREPGYPGPPAQIRTCALAHTAPTLGG